MRKSLASFAALVTLIVSPVAADHMYVDTETLYGWCRPHEVGPSSAPYCTGYVNGVADILAHGIAIHDNRACVPEDVRLNDLRNLVVSALERRPKVAHKNAHDWVAQAIADAFPCHDWSGGF